MEDIFSKVVAMILGCVLMIMLPLTVIRERQKNMEQTYIYTETIRFVDSVCNKGIIYDEVYLDYIKRLGMTNGIYRVKIETYKKNQEEFGEYTKQILGALELQQRYELKKGDLLRVSVENVNGEPVVYYGGRIKDEDY